MAYYINDDCTNCGTCAEDCPASCIAEGDDKYVIDAGKCDDCGTCMENCPSDAIVQA